MRRDFRNSASSSKVDWVRTGSLHDRSLPVTDKTGQRHPRDIAGTPRRYEDSYLRHRRARGVGSEYIGAPKRLLAFAVANENSVLADLLMIAVAAGIAFIVFAYPAQSAPARRESCTSWRPNRFWNLARHDALTGLPNRRYFTEMVTATLQGVKDHDARTAVLMFRPDRLQGGE